MTDRSKLLKGFRTIGHLAISATEVMGDPCQLLNRDDGTYERFITQIAHLPTGRWRWEDFEGAKIRVLLTGMDGAFYGTGTDTGCIIRMSRADWQRLKGTGKSML